VSEEPRDMPFPPYAPWRRLLEGGDAGATILVTGPLVGGIVDAARQVAPERRPSVWLLSELPIVEPEQAFVEDVKRSGHLVVVEEHVAQGGVGGMIAACLLARGIAPRRFTHQAARGYPSGLYGSQKFHRQECGLDPASVLAIANQD
jgi:transketolase